MEKVLYEERPKMWETTRSFGVMLTVVRFGITEVEGGWECEDVVYVHKEPLTMEKDYAALISAIVRARYSQSDVEAIQMNYLESKTTAHVTEFEDLKAWRNEAKQMARLILN